MKEEAAEAQNNQAMPVASPNASFTLYFVLKDSMACSLPIIKHSRGALRIGRGGGHSQPESTTSMSVQSSSMCTFGTPAPTTTFGTPAPTTPGPNVENILSSIVLCAETATYSQHWLPDWMAGGMWCGERNSPMTAPRPQAGRSRKHG